MSIFESMKEDQTFASIYEYESLLRAIEEAKDRKLIEAIPVAAKRVVPQIRILVPRDRYRNWLFFASSRVPR